LTIGPLLVHGPQDAVAALHRWSDMSIAGVAALHGRSESLAAVVARFGAPPGVVALFDIACVAAVLVALHRKGGGVDVVAEVATLALLALLLTPIAHAHYYLLAFPAWLVALRRGPPRRGRRVWFAIVGAAAILTCGILTVWSSTSRHRLWDYSIYAWGGLLLLVALLQQVPADSQAELSRTTGRE